VNTPAGAHFKDTFFARKHCLFGGEFYYGINKLILRGKCFSAFLNFNDEERINLTVILRPEMYY
jgi:hypothetical protein